MHETIINMIILTKSNCLNCVREVTVYMEAFKATPNKDVVPFLRLHHVWSPALMVIIIILLSMFCNYENIISRQCCHEYGSVQSLLLSAKNTERMAVF